ncbi:MAG: hypothetical protein QXM42_01570 [Zestosphaera sp.]
MSIPVSIKVRRELVELADKIIIIIIYSIARSRSYAFNIMIEKGIAEITREVEHRDNICRRVEELEK